MQKNVTNWKLPFSKYHSNNQLGQNSQQMLKLVGKILMRRIFTLSHNITQYTHKICSLCNYKGKK